MAKKKDLPAMPFYFGDWRKAPEIRALDLDVRMIWFEMLGFMWESTERGYFTIKGKPVITPVISKMLGIDITAFKSALDQMEEFDVFSKREDGAIYSRKMVADEEIRLNKSLAGKKGMEKRYSDITPVITDSEDESEIVLEDKDQKKKDSIVLHSIQEIIKTSYPNISKMSKQLTYNEAERLLKEFGEKTLDNYFIRMENYKLLAQKNISVNLTLRNWYNRDNPTQIINDKIIKCPKGHTKIKHLKKFNDGDLYKCLDCSAQWKEK